MTDTALWTAEEAAIATGGLLCARGERDADEWRAGGVSIDTRTLEPGDLFVALTGGARDGHEFVRGAFEAGAAAALVSQTPDDAPKNAPLLVVDDTLQALRALGVAARTRAPARRIAVTGSVGKTSVKEMLRAGLAPSGATHASVKSYNNHLGVPLTLARLPAETQYGVFEIGMNHAGEIEDLSPLVAPDVAVITAIGAAHLEFFDSIEGIAEAKAEIFIGLKDGGLAIIHRDTPYWPLLARRAEERGAGRIVSFGETDEADYRLLQAHPAPGGGLTVHAVCEGEPVEFSLAVDGRHMALNALAALAGIAGLGGERAGALEALSRHLPSEGRGVRARIATPAGRITLIDESYNANPSSMAAAIAVLGGAAPEAGGRRVAVLGDMLELGPDGPRLHADLSAPLREANVDRVYAAGPLMAHLWETLPEDRRALYAAESNALKDRLIEDLREGDVIMIKGSLGSRMKPLVEALIALGDAGGED